MSSTNSSQQTSINATHSQLEKLHRHLTDLCVNCFIFEEKILASPTGSEEYNEDIDTISREYEACTNLLQQIQKVVPADRAANGIKKLEDAQMISWWPDPTMMALFFCETQSRMARRDLDVLRKVAGLRPLRAARETVVGQPD